MRVLGAVLAGGRSRRFGSDKAVAIWRERPLIEHVIAAIRPQAAAVLICGRDLPGEICVPDRPTRDLGPLGGLNAALTYGAAHGFDQVLSAPCDVPTLPDSLIRQLLDHRAAAYLADLPVIGIWPVTLAAALDRHLATDPRRAVRDWAEAVAASPVRLSEPGAVPNVNRPADLAALDASPQ